MKIKMLKVKMYKFICPNCGESVLSADRKTRFCESCDENKKTQEKSRAMKNVVASNEIKNSIKSRASDTDLEKKAKESLVLAASGSRVSASLEAKYARAMMKPEDLKKEK